MKFIVYDWARACGEKLRLAGYGHNYEVEEDMFEAVRKIYDAGLNVMVYHRCEGECPVLFVDTKKFQQR